MALHPLDMQVVLGQMDYVGKDYLRLYTNARKDQIHHGTLYEQKTNDIDNKVIDLPEEVNEYQSAYLDPHDSENPRKRGMIIRKGSAKPSDNEDEYLYKEKNKGNLVDILQ